MIRPFALVAALLLLVGAAPLRALETFELDDLVVETTDGNRHAFRVELALSPAQKSQGLMFRPRLDADAGMLFLHARPRVLTMWMKNTLIPLDMIFISSDGTVIAVAEETTPRSLDVISSEAPAKAVLEVAGGTARRLGITPGAKVLHEAFGTAG